MAYELCSSKSSKDFEKVKENPEKFKPLRYELKGKRSARVGKWRIVYMVEDEKIIILSIAPRKKVYERM
ncbi:hypothetical protein B6U71_01095 [Euryarchaeota archaeon ex4484_178]|nr:MAG: hypothetical protein B6U71_01095 [Euryarchaeota archaeon ex4484_178]